MLVNRREVTGTAQPSQRALSEARSCRCPRVPRHARPAERLLGVLVAALLVACGGDSGGSTSSAAAPAPATSAPPASSTAGPPLEGTSWSLTQVAGAAAQPGGLLAFARGGHLTGSTGCNDFGGTYTQSGSSLTITMGFQTAKACGPPLDAQETAVNAAVPKVASVTNGGSTLTLLDASGTALLTLPPGARRRAGRPALGGHRDQQRAAGRHLGDRRQHRDGDVRGGRVGERLGRLQLLLRALHPRRRAR